MEHYNPVPAPTEGIPHITDNGENPNYPHLFNGQMTDMTYEVQMLTKQAGPLLNKFAYDIPNMLHDKGVNPINQEIIQSDINSSKIRRERLKPADVNWVPPMMPILHLVPVEYPFL